MKAMLDPRIATTKTQRPVLRAHGVGRPAPCKARIAASSHGGFAKLPIPHSAPLNVTGSRTVRDYNK
jgi:hypothetical protein